jgi:hypothetical protein
MWQEQLDRQLPCVLMFSVCSAHADVENILVEKEIDDDHIIVATESGETGFSIRVGLSAQSPLIGWASLTYLSSSYVEAPPPEHATGSMKTLWVSRPRAVRLPSRPTFSRFSAQANPARGGICYRVTEAECVSLSPLTV